MYRLIIIYCNWHLSRNPEASDERDIGRLVRYESLKRSSLLAILRLIVDFNTAQGFRSYHSNQWIERIRDQFEFGTIHWGEVRDCIKYKRMMD